MHEVASDDHGHWGNCGREVKVRIGVQKMTEDAGECAPEKASALFVHKLASPLSTALQARHNISEEAEMAGVILGVGMRGMLIADGTKRLVGLRPEVPKHGSVLAQ